MNNLPPYSAEPPGAAEGRGYGSRGGYGVGAPPGSVPPPPTPPWPGQHGQPGQPGPYSQWPPFQPPPFSHPPLFDPSRPPPGFFGEQQNALWPPPASRGQQAHVGTDRGSFDQGGPFTNFGPPPIPTPCPPVHQPRFHQLNPPASPSFTPDYHKPHPSSFPHHINNPPEGHWSGDGQNNGNRTTTTTSTTSMLQVTPDADTTQRIQDEQWVKGFLQRRRRSKPAASAAEAAQHPPKQSVSDFRHKLYSTVHMLSELTLLCQTLKNNLENQGVWTEAYSRAGELKSSLQERLAGLQDREVISRVKKNLELIKKKRACMRRRRAERMEEKQEEERRAAEREAAMDKFQLKQIQELEEKNRERELKLAADAVLSEVRKKQADSKRMLDILKALEKLRKLRKEAASRKGMFPEKECDEVFEGHLTRLRSLIKKRTAVYGAEEKALRVMLEGEQEEERKRDREKRLKKEREKLLLKKQEIDSMLFGAELPPDHPLQPFQEYYTQAEHSLPVLIQIRREWDQFLVPVDHPDGTSIPPCWVLPDPPADDVWATALEK
ncbi:programmed cell death protein 7 [Astyanax mexicanus]|uniref:programmed cell death protein 7 n=1 Tax=Astyanax mexicanus TaxID=7994 RepID=UPI0020CB3ED4|nr:programmed cell death protein 7 [Astyanax mexicanus]